MKTTNLFIPIVLALWCAGCGGGGDSTMPQGADPAPMMVTPMVFTMTNETSGNRVLAYRRTADGTLMQFADLATGGTGVGHGLRNQGAVTLSQDGHFLYVANPGSNDLTVFRVARESLQLVDRVDSGGALPVSVAEWNGVVYVLNRNATNDAATGPTIQGYRVSSSGMLTTIPGSLVAVHPTDTGAAQIAISPDGQWLAVTERATSQIDVIPLDHQQVPGTPLTMTSAGAGPFGFAFSDSVRLYVSEETAGTTSAYDLDPQGMLHALSAAVPTQQQATCWLAISPDNRFVYTANTSSGSISSYQVSGDGKLTLLLSVAAKAAGRPIDVTIDASGDYLSVLTTDGSIETFRIDVSSGALSSIQTITGLPAGTNGLIGS